MIHLFIQRRKFNFYNESLYKETNKRNNNRFKIYNLNGNILHACIDEYIS